MFGAAPQNTKAVIFAPSGPVLTADEVQLFRDSSPLGFILFQKPGAHNIENPEQLKALTASLKETVGWDCPVLIDQEGGRVQRMKAPHWPRYPAMQVFGDQAVDDLDSALEALRINIFQMMEDLTEAGINVDCIPVADILFPETHDIIGDRSFGSDPALVGRLCEAVCRYALEGGVTPIIKHIPGHGRATSDSHLDLPVVKASKEELQQSDFKPFATVAASPVGPRVWGMTAHVVYEALDVDHPGTLSPQVISDVIRGEIGFDGFLLSDDLDMKALDKYGQNPDKAKLALEAGCDAVLHCSGDFEAMVALADSVPNLSRDARKRLQSGANIA